LTIFFVPKSNFAAHFFSNSSGLILGSYLAVVAVTRIAPTINLTVLLLLLLISIIFGDVQPVVEIVTAIFLSTYQSKNAKFALKFFQNKLLVQLGVISYSIYLWHTLVITVVGKYLVDAYIFQNILSVSLSIAVGYLSYIFLEVPSRKFIIKMGKDKRKKYNQV